MISYTEARAIIDAAASRLPTEHLPLDALDGHVTATELRSDRLVPAFANSAMDGYAMPAAATTNASPQRPVGLRVAGMVTAGRAAPASTPAGSAWEIMTGAAIPAGCDAVIPLERVECSGNDNGNRAIRVLAPVTAGLNIRCAGEDFERGQLLLAAGTAISPHVVMSLAAAVTGPIEVARKPRVAILCTGDELAGANNTSEPGMIADVNGPYLLSVLKSLGLPVTSHGRAADDPRELATALRECCKYTDVILTTGGVSAGRKDLVPAAVRALDAKILFHKVAIRPGKPVLLARFPDGPLVFGLPGNPVSVAVGVRFFVIPALRAMQGMAREHYWTARCPAPLNKRAGLTFFAKARAAIAADAALEVRILPGQESFKISPLLAANCWAILPETLESSAGGQQIEIAPLYPGGFAPG